MILIKDAEVYDPSYSGIKDVLIGGKEILAVDEGIDISGLGIKIIDGKGKKVVPGFIDQHVHITGGGGENSFRSRVAEVHISDLINGGITTVLGLLGTDSVTRNIENLVAKAKGLKEEGISAYVVTGSYEYPTCTLTDSVKKDIIFIEEVIGCKAALSDHRDSAMTTDELARLAMSARVGGLLSGKEGILVIHMGNGKRTIEQIFEAVECSEVPVTTFRPTHMSKSDALIADGFKLAKMGGYIDFTSGSRDIRNGALINMAVEAQVPLDRITFSSDGNGSWSKYDESGRITAFGVASVSKMFQEFRLMVDSGDFTVAEALPFYTENVSRALGLYPAKGCLKAGSDADLLILDEDNRIETVIAMGQTLMEDHLLVCNPARMGGGCDE